MNNNLPMLDLVSTFNGGEMMYSQTNASFPRKLALFVKHIENFVAGDIRVHTTDPEQAKIEFYPNQDKTEMELIGEAIARDMPFLGVCRGMQMMSVMHGGRLYQHLDTTPGHEGHGGFDGVETRHGVSATEGSLLANLMGTSIDANSTHHQGVADAGDLTVTGIADHDGLIEAVERPDKKFCLGVQWHPERAGHVVLYSGLVEAARG